MIRCITLLGSAVIVAAILSAPAVAQVPQATQLPAAPDATPEEIAARFGGKNVVRFIRMMPLVKNLTSDAPSQTECVNDMHNKSGLDCAVYIDEFKLERGNGIVARRVMRSRSESSKAIFDTSLFDFHLESDGRFTIRPSSAPAGTAPLCLTPIYSYNWALAYSDPWLELQYCTTSNVDQKFFLQRAPGIDLQGKGRDGYMSIFRGQSVALANNVDTGYSDKITFFADYFPYEADTFRIRSVASPNKCWSAQGNSSLENRRFSMVPCVQEADYHTPTQTTRHKSKFVFRVPTADMVDRWQRGEKGWDYSWENNPVFGLMADAFHMQDYEAGATSPKYTNGKTVLRITSVEEVVSSYGRAAGLIQPNGASLYTGTSGMRDGTYWGNSLLTFDVANAIAITDTATSTYEKMMEHTVGIVLQNGPGTPSASWGFKFGEKWVSTVTKSKTATDTITGKMSFNANDPTWYYVENKSYKGNSFVQVSNEMYETTTSPAIGYSLAKGHVSPTQRCTFSSLNYACRGSQPDPLIGLSFNFPEITTYNSTDSSLQPPNYGYRVLLKAINSPDSDSCLYWTGPGSALATRKCDATETAFPSQQWFLQQVPGRHGQYYLRSLSHGGSLCLTAWGAGELGNYSETTGFIPSGASFNNEIGIIKCGSTPWFRPYGASVASRLPISDHWIRFYSPEDSAYQYGSKQFIIAFGTDKIANRSYMPTIASNLGLQAAAPLEAFNGAIVKPAQRVFAGKFIIQPLQDLPSPLK